MWRPFLRLLRRFGRRPHMSGGGDMHRADIVALIKKRGFTLEGLAKSHGLSKAAISVGLHKPWRRVEVIIAETIGLPASTIWPSRYSGDDAALGGP